MTTDTPNTNVRDAARLLMMSMTAGVNATQNKEYQLLLQRYNGEPEFRAVVQQAAEGMDIHILESDVRNLYVRAETKDSVFAYKLTDIRTYSPQQRIAYFLCTISLAASFFPDVHSLTSSGSLAPLTKKELHDALSEHIASLDKAQDHLVFKDSVLKTGLDILKALPVITMTASSSSRARLNTRTGILELVINDLKDQGFLRIDDKSNSELVSIYPTHKFRQHLGAEGGAIETLMTLLKKESNE